MAATPSSTPKSTGGKKAAPKRRGHSSSVKVTDGEGNVTIKEQDEITGAKQRAAETIASATPEKFEQERKDAIAAQAEKEKADKEAKGEARRRSEQSNQELLEKASSVLAEADGPLTTAEICEKAGIGKAEDNFAPEGQKLYLAMLASTRAEDGVIVKAGSRAKFDLRTLNPVTGTDDKGTRLCAPYRPGSEAEKAAQAAEAEKARKAEEKAAKAAEAEALAKQEAEKAAAEAPPEGEPKPARKTRKTKAKTGSDGQPATTGEKVAA